MQFRPGGKSGVPVSDLFPNVRDCVDDMCVIRSMVGRCRSRRGFAPDVHGHKHAYPAQPGFVGNLWSRLRKPRSAWIRSNQAIPGAILREELSSAFLPGAYQATAIGHAGLKVDNIKLEPIEYLRQSECRRRYDSSWTWCEISTSDTKRFVRAIPSLRHGYRLSSWHFECRLKPQMCFELNQKVMPQRSFMDLTIR